MRTTLQVTSPPAIEPVPLAIAKQHCRVDHSADDDLIQSYVTAARVMVEGYLSRALITQTLAWTLRPEDQLNPNMSRVPRSLYLPRAPVQSLTSVIATDYLGNTTTFTPATLPTTTPLLGYVLDLSLEPGRMIIGETTPMTGGLLPASTVLDNLRIVFVAGYGLTADDVPQNIRLAIQMLTAFIYENRGDVPADMPKAAEWLLSKDRLQWLGA